MAFADWARIERVNPGGHAEVGYRRIYILPTRYGLIFGALLFLMLLGSVNYGNNPAHLLTFLLAALTGNAIYQTWRNLRGLQLVCQGGPPSFAGQPARFVVELLSGPRERPAIQLAVSGAEPALLDLRADGGNGLCMLSVSGLGRGEHHPGRLVISTQYPLGLFRAWCYVDCDRPLLVYPRPGPAWHPPLQDGGDVDGTGAGLGNEDFAGLRNYRVGDQPAQIDWKSYARDRGLNTRVFSGQAAAPLWLRWDDAPGTDTETKLSALSRGVLDAERRGQPYGLQTPTLTLQPSLGVAHRHQCLRHLALYGGPLG